MKNYLEVKLTAAETAITNRAIELLQRWDWQKGEPLAALTIACKDLHGVEHHSSLANIGKLERLYAPCGSMGNNAEQRLASLNAVVRHHGHITP